MAFDRADDEMEATRYTAGELPYECWTENVLTKLVAHCLSLAAAGNVTASH